MLFDAHRVPKKLKKKVHFANDAQYCQGYNHIDQDK